MKLLAALIGSTTLLTAVALHADEDIGVDQALQLQQSGIIKPFEVLNLAALAKHPNGVIADTDLEHEHGKYVYKVELRDAHGKQWDVDLDAASGAILANLEDN